MRKGKRSKHIGKDAAGSLPAPDSGQPPSRYTSESAPKSPEELAGDETLHFRVDLPSRRWLKLAAGNGVASGS
ncbi:MAG: hypothetical protein ABSH10_09945 [Phycisphaerae bacterium]|jgi:hypothetical protein